MDKLLKAAYRAGTALFVPEMLGVFVQSILLSIFVLATFASVVSYICLQLPGLGMLPASFVHFFGPVAAFMLAWFLFPGITPVIVSFFDVRITKLIERHTYPGVAQPQELPFWPEFWHDVRFALKALLLNILVLPLYLLPGLNLVLFYLLNGYLLGREYFVMAARRHMPVAEAEALRKRNAMTVLGGGILLTLLATIPVLNLFAPFWGVALMVHLYHATNGTRVAVLPPAV